MFPLVGEHPRTFLLPPTCTLSLLPLLFLSLLTPVPIPYPTFPTLTMKSFVLLVDVTIAASHHRRLNGSLTTLATALVTNPATFLPEHLLPCNMSVLSHLPPTSLQSTSRIPTSVLSPLICVQFYGGCSAQVCIEGPDRVHVGCTTAFEEKEPQRRKVRGLGFGYTRTGTFLKSEGLTGSKMRS